MRGVILLTTLLAACIATQIAACPIVTTHSCVKDKDPAKCTAQVACERSVEEPCGSTSCEYPFVCATSARQECAQLPELAKKCETRKVCKEAKKPCGAGTCSMNQDCVKERVCSVKSAAGRSLAVVPEDSTANGYVAYVNTPYQRPCGYCSADEILQCEDTFKCVAKEPCQDVIVKKCVSKMLRAGIDVVHDAHEFRWCTESNEKKCGDEHCSSDYACAEVFMQTCKTQCGETECDNGFECIDEIEGCEDYQLLKHMCRDVNAPTCVKLTPYMQLLYKPPCKINYDCEKEHSTCGNTYCSSGYSCIVDEKKSCNTGYKAAGDQPLVERPYSIATLMRTRKLMTFSGQQHFQRALKQFPNGPGLPGFLSTPVGEGTTPPSNAFSFPGFPTSPVGEGTTPPSNAFSFPGFPTSPVGEGPTPFSNPFFQNIFPSNGTLG